MVSLKLKEQVFLFYPNLFDMTNKSVAIITGASRGIGKAVAEFFANAGYQLVLVARNKEKLEQLSNDIQKQNNCPAPMLFAFDVGNSEKINSCINHVIDTFGRIDILVNNAGIYLEGTSSIEPADFNKQLAINLTAPFEFLKLVVPVMKLQQSGAIFNIASRAGKVGFSDSGGYSASKFGLVGLSESFYRELAPFGISVTAICPGWVNTEMAYVASTPLKGQEMIQAEDIAKTIEYVLSLSPRARVKEIILESAKSIH